jgi:hypothetical protein
MPPAGELPKKIIVGVIKITDSLARFCHSLTRRDGCTGKSDTYKGMKSQYSAAIVVGQFARNIPNERKAALAPAFKTWSANSDGMAYRVRSQGG